MSNFHSIKIKQIRYETKNAISVLFDIPSNLQKEYNFIAGQYINIRKTIKSKELRRAYSICSPSCSNELRIVIKIVPNGLFSNYAYEYLKAGSFIDIGNPEGNFTFEPETSHKKNYVAFAAGSGITPIMSILTTVLRSEPMSSFILVYGNKTPEDTIFQEQINHLHLQYKDRFFVHFVYSQSKIENALFGRIEHSVVNYILRNKHKEMEFSKFYLCGPENMVNVIRDSLRENNIEEDKIKFELFTSSSKENPIDIPLDGQTKISILVDDDESSFVMSKQMTILEAALKQGIDVPYSCQGGVCNSCLARIISGTAEMKKNPILTDEEVSNGLILTCQAHPTSNNIYIDYDNT